MPSYKKETIALKAKLVTLKKIIVSYQLALANLDLELEGLNIDENADNKITELLDTTYKNIEESVLRHNSNGDIEEINKFIYMPDAWTSNELIGKKPEKKN
tara:strand:- start:333 stop:635 length:303 start_codon:yes stop_codon:yes gene_type:complete